MIFKLHAYVFLGILIYSCNNKTRLRIEFDSEPNTYNYKDQYLTFEEGFFSDSVLLKTCDSLIIYEESISTDESNSVADQLILSISDVCSLIECNINSKNKFYFKPNSRYKYIRINKKNNRIFLSYSNKQIYYY
jgi:hypothetical protein